MKNCKHCGKETNSTYFSKELRGTLCSKCTKFILSKDLYDLSKKINNLEQKKSEINDKIKQSELADCKHINRTVQKLLIPKDGKLFKEYICDDCGKQILEEKVM